MKTGKKRKRIAPQPVLIAEQTQFIAGFKANLDHAVGLLNSINSQFPIKSAGEVPNESILRHLNLKDPLNADLHARGLEPKLLPQLQHLKYLLEEFRVIPKNGIELIERNEDKFYMNREKLDFHCDRFRTFASTPEQLQRLEMATTYLGWLETLKIGVNDRLHHYKIPMVSLVPNIESKFVGVNLNWVLKGESYPSSML